MKILKKKKKMGNKERKKMMMKIQSLIHGISMLQLFLRM
jgi:hypothetical protein